MKYAASTLVDLAVAEVVFSLCSSAYDRTRALFTHRDRVISYEAV